jgi:flagellar protein FliO/FliZ
MTEMAPPASAVSAGSLMQLSLSLLAIVLLIFAIGWVLKRFKLAVPRGSGNSAVLDELSIGPRERIVLVRVGDAHVLIGVGAAGMVSLTPLSTPIVVKSGSPTPPFAERLRDMMKRQA